MLLTSTKLTKTLALGLILVLSYVGTSDGLLFGGLFNWGSGSQTPAPAPQPTVPRVGFYNGTCHNVSTVFDVEAIIGAEVSKEFGINPLIVPALLRLQFHDCFVDNGCDASILIAGTGTERDADENQSVRGYEFIDKVKDILEGKCPGVVSCADIIVLATKFAIKLGGGPDIAAETGRKDGLVSNKGFVNLPSPFDPLDVSVASFSRKGFTVQEIVALLGGGHSVGIVHCEFFEDRLYSNTTKFDPNMNSDLRTQLMGICPQNMKSKNFASLDQNTSSSNTVDNSIFNQITQMNKGVLQIDQDLARNPSTSADAFNFARDSTSFRNAFVQAMIKLQRLRDVTGAGPGNIRNKCSRLN